MASEYGRFEGEVLTKWLKNEDDDRNMELLEDFAYVDPDGKRWRAGKGKVINGASIPWIFWSTVGTPYVGDYRRASVVHDVACVEMTEPSKDVHRMFYHAMLCDGVPSGKAYRMYTMVDWYGPSWPDPRKRAVRGVKAAEAAQPARQPSYEEMSRLQRAVDKALADVGATASLDELDAAVGRSMAAQTAAANRKSSTPSGSTRAKGGRKKPSGRGG